MIFTKIVNSNFVVGIFLFTVLEVSGAFEEEKDLITDSPLGLREAANCSCGVPGKSASKGQNVGKIINGTNAPNHRWRWHGLMYRSNSVNCGASLITDRHVLTAAHCVKGYQMKDIRIDLHEYDRSKTSDGQVISRNIAKMTIHPQYNVTDYLYDVAILKLDKVVSLGRTEEPIVTPVCLPNINNNNRYDDNDWTTATGFGVMTDSGQASQILQQIEIPILTNSKCSDLYKNKRKITQSMMCAGSTGRGPSKFDAGGPLVFKGIEGRYTQIGIMSYVRGNAKEGMPSVSIRTRAVRNWIQNNTSDGRYCQKS